MWPVPRGRFRQVSDPDTCGGTGGRDLEKDGKTGYHTSPYLTTELEDEEARSPVSSPLYRIRHCILGSGGVSTAFGRERACQLPRVFQLPVHLIMASSSVSSCHLPNGAIRSTRHLQPDMF